MITAVVVGSRSKFKVPAGNGQSRVQPFIELLVQFFASGRTFFNFAIFDEEKERQLA